jgi:DNA polymerase IV
MLLLKRDNPELKGKPLAVAWSGRRGVVLTANYATRAFGVRSAMPTNIALKKYPALLLIPPCREVWRETLGRIHGVFRRYTDIIELFSLDEAYPDVSHTKVDLHSVSILTRQKVES